MTFVLICWLSSFSVLIVVNHYLAFSYFASEWHPFSEVSPANRLILSSILCPAPSKVFKVALPWLAWVHVTIPPWHHSEIFFCSPFVHHFRLASLCIIFQLQPLSASLSSYSPLVHHFPITAPYCITFQLQPLRASLSSCKKVRRQLWGGRPVFQTYLLGENVPVHCFSM